MKKFFNKLAVLLSGILSVAHASEQLGLTYRGNAMYDLTISRVQNAVDDPFRSYLVNFDLLEPKDAKNASYTYRIHCPSKTVHNMADASDRPYRSAMMEDNIAWSGEYVLRFVTKSICQRYHRHS